MIKETMEFLSQYDPEVGATIEKEYHTSSATSS